MMDEARQEATNRVIKQAEDMGTDAIVIVRYATSNILNGASWIQYGFKKFHIIAEENDEIVGILVGFTVFSEIYVDDLIVHEKFRGQGIGRRLLQKLEEYFEGKNYTNINLVTSEFQAPEFYKKCGYALEFVRKNPQFLKFTKYFFIKWLKPHE